jgi:hypothetical protein
MATLQELQLELEAKQKAIQEAQKAKIDAIMAQRKAEQEAAIAAEAAKTDEQKASDLQVKINEAAAHLAQLQK